MKYYAAVLRTTPLRPWVTVFGGMELYDEFYLTPPRSLDHLKALLGTVQGRLEMAGAEFEGAQILPYGAKPQPHKSWPQEGPLKARLDYGVHTWDLRPNAHLIYAQELEHPDTVIFEPNEYYPAGLREQDIHEYYQNMADKIIGQYVENNVDGMIVMKVDDQIMVRRHASRLEMAGMNLGTSEAFSHINNGRTVEFHFAIGPTTKMVWIDLDPKEEFTFENAKEIAAELVERMNDLDEVDLIKTEVRFSGKSGFHVYGYLREEIGSDDARDMMKRFAEDYIQKSGNNKLTTSITRDPQAMRLDVSTLHQAGGLRAPWSLAYPSGLVCLPLTPDELSDFDKEQARIDAVIKREQFVTRGAALEEYQQKRDFEKTPEPRGEPSEAGGIYAVQFHEAKKRGDHYDLRIEHEGVLASFVLPKFPEMGSSVDVPRSEDHAIQHVTETPKKFTIEEGYGAGDVTLDTKGRREIVDWTPNHIKVKFLDGKYPGTYSLIKMGGKIWRIHRKPLEEK